MYLFNGVELGLDDDVHLNNAGEHHLRLCDLSAR